MDDNVFKFLLSEHGKLREEILQHIKQMEDDERWVLVSTGAFWAWLFTHAPLAEKYEFVFWLPCIVNVFFLVRWWIIREAIIKIHKYFLILESQFHLIGLPLILGWENYIKRNNNRDWMDWKSLAFLIALFTCNGFIGYWLFNHIDLSNFHLY